MNFNEILNTEECREFTTWLKDNLTDVAVDGLGARGAAESWLSDISQQGNIEIQARFSKDGCPKTRAFPELAAILYS